MNARDAIRDVSARFGWVVDRVSDDGRTATFVRGAAEITVRYTVNGSVHAAWNGENEITGRGKREAVLFVLETPASTVEPEETTDQVTVTGFLDGHQTDNPVHRVTVHPGTVLSIRDGDHGPEFLANNLWWVTTPEALAAQTAVETSPGITLDAGPTYPEAATQRAAAEVGDIPSAPAPSLTRADEVRAGDYVHHAGKERRVIGTRTEGRDIVLSTVHGTLTMLPGTPLRVSPAQLSLISSSEGRPSVLAGVA